MIQRLHGTLAAKSIQRLERQHIKVSARCPDEHLLELLTVATLAAGVVYELLDYFQPSVLAKALS
jgi:hypothetical protein